MKKYLLNGLLILTFCMLFVACGTDEKVEDTTEISTNENENNEVVKENDVSSPELETNTEISDEETDVTTEEVTLQEEAVTEMVDFETWATQEGNDEVCMVVWNEKTGTQKILEPSTDEKTFVYNVKEGDRFAVPRRNNIMSVSIGFEENFYWQSAEQKYIELEIPVGEKKVIYIACENEEWARSYLFNF